MATKQQVIDANREHPEWTAGQIAEALFCCSGYVRATAQRQGLTLAKVPPCPTPKARLRRAAPGLLASLKLLVAAAHMSDLPTPGELADAEAAIAQAEGAS